MSVMKSTWTWDAFPICLCVFGGEECGVRGKLGLLWAGKLYVGQGSYNADGKQFKDVQMDLGLQIQDCSSTCVQLAIC